MRKVANVNKQYSGICMLLNTTGLSKMVRQWNSIITYKIANLKTQSGDYLLVIIGASYVQYFTS